MENDLYRTVASPCQASLRERSSRFLSFVYPVSTEEEIKERVEELKKQYFDATHHCYAWRLGPQGERFRQNDDGEPSGTAGKPILGQIVKEDLTDCLIVVVRYFGGTKLGTSGLIQTYRESAAQVLSEAEIITKTVDASFSVAFPYESLDSVLRAVRECGAKVLKQDFDNTCTMDLSIRLSREEELRNRLEKVEGAGIL